MPITVITCTVLLITLFLFVLSKQNSHFIRNCTNSWIRRLSVPGIWAYQQSAWAATKTLHSVYFTNLISRGFKLTSLHLHRSWRLLLESNCRIIQYKHHHQFSALPGGRSSIPKPSNLLYLEPFSSYDPIIMWSIITIFGLPLGLLITFKRPNSMIMISKQQHNCQFTAIFLSCTNIGSWTCVDNLHEN